MSDQFGTIVTRWQVEQALIAVLQQPPPSPATGPALVYYLAEVERQMGLPAQTLGAPPGASSYRGGADALTMQPEWFPMVTIVAEPDGAPEYLDAYTVGQSYRARAVCYVGNDSEDTARMVADGYGAAVARCILDFGSLGGLSAQTRLISAPSTEPLDGQNVRQVMVCTVGFSVLIAPVFTLGAPSVWQASPYSAPGSLPTVQTTDVTVAAQPL